MRKFYPPSQETIPHGMGECEDNASADVAKGQAQSTSADNPPKPKAKALWRRRVHKGIMGLPVGLHAWLVIVWWLCALPVCAWAQCTFEGNLDFAQKKFTVDLQYAPEGGTAHIDFAFLDPDTFSLFVKIDHGRLFSADVSTDINAHGAVVRSDTGSWQGFKGVIETRYPLVNFKPFAEVQGFFELTRASLTIHSLLWGAMRMAGEIGLSAPYQINFTVDIIDMDINELIQLSGIATQGISMSGMVSGQLKIEGPFMAPQIQGELRARQGAIDTIKYSEIVAHINGIYPRLRLSDSVVYAQGGQEYSLVGKFNARELDNPASPGHDVQMVPQVSDDFRWDTWTLRRKELYGRDDTVEFEYQLKEGGPLKMRLRENEEILSLEHSLRF